MDFTLNRTWPIFYDYIPVYKIWIQYTNLFKRYWTETILCTGCTYTDRDDTIRPCEDSDQTLCFAASDLGSTLFTHAWPELIKLFSCSTQLSMKLSLLINNSWHFHIYRQRNFHAQLICLARMNLQLRFISRRNFMLSWVEHEKSFIILRPGSILRVNMAAIVFD